MSLRFIIPGEPRAWQRAGENRGRRFNPKQHADHAKTIAQYADLAIRESGHRGEYPCGGPFWLEVKFYLGRYGNGPHMRAYDCDLDNLLKLVGDALQGVIWHNDKQLHGLTASKRLGDPRPRTEIQVTAIAGALLA